MSAPPASDVERARTGVSGLDEVLRGGLNGAGEGLESVAHSVVELEQLAPDYGIERRRLRIVKLRGSRYRGGYHDYLIKTGGVAVFPRLVAAEHDANFAPRTVSSGLPELDALLGGGLDTGTSALFIGPARVGKSALASQYATAAAQRGERSAVYIFDESVPTYLKRSTGLGIPVDACAADGRIALRRLDPAQLSPGEFDHLVRDAVREGGAKVVIIDSLNGYLNAMAEEKAVLVQLHELLSYLGEQGILTILTIAQHGLVGDQPQAPVDVSYLADAVVLLRYFEAAGELRQAISVVKKRSGVHERTIRELKLGPGIRVGGPLGQFQGVLAPSPSYLGSQGSLFTDGGS
jgi:circadian clock protein KaiC